MVPLAWLGENSRSQPIYDCPLPEGAARIIWEFRGVFRELLSSPAGTIAGLTILAAVIGACAQRILYGSSNPAGAYAIVMTGIAAGLIGVIIERPYQFFGFDAIVYTAIGASIASALVAGAAFLRAPK